MKKMICNHSTLLGLFFALIAFPALALDLAQARAQGVVGELSNGYVAIIKGGTEVQSLVTDINARRKQEYQRISKENGETVDVVAKLAAVQVIQKLPSDSLYQSSDGKWVKK
jgi:uncharacterized protein YdbL (DUF1318 family)